MPIAGRGEVSGAACAAAALAPWRRAHAGVRAVRRRVDAGAAARTAADAAAPGGDRGRLGRRRHGWPRRTADGVDVASVRDRRHRHGRRRR